MSGRRFFTHLVTAFAVFFLIFSFFYLPRSGAVVLEVVETFPRNAGILKKMDFPLVIKFSGPVDREVFSFKVSPDPGGWDTIWRNGMREVKIVTSGGFGRNTMYRVDLRLSVDGPVYSFSFFVSGPDSISLIDEAETEGELSYDEAWILRIRALFDTSGLPPEYSSGTPLICGTPVLDRFFRESENLKEETLEQLTPYLEIPKTSQNHLETKDTRDTSSAMAIASAWASPADDPSDDRPATHTYSAPCRKAPVVVWSLPRDAFKARKARDMLDSYDMYNKFKKLMGREPPKDTGQEPLARDHRLDVFILAPPKTDPKDGSAPQDCWSGLCRSILPGDVVSPSCLYISRGLEGEELGSTLAHELFHAFQNAFSVYEDTWLKESTAVWAEDFICSEWNMEQYNLEYFFLPDRNRMDTLTINSGSHPYGAYLFPFFLTSYAFKSEKIIGDIWHAAADSSSRGSLEDLNHALEGKFEELFREFALVTMDLPPFEDIYPASEKHKPPFMDIRAHHKEMEIILYQPGEETVDIDLPPLSAVYVSIENCLAGSGPAFIRIDLEDFLDDHDVLSVQTVIDEGRVVPPGDLTGQKDLEFQVNREEGDGRGEFEKMILVFTSTDRERTRFNRLRVQVRQAGFSGTICYDREIDFQKKVSNETGRGEGKGILQESATLHLKLKYKNTYQGRDYYKIEEASGTYSYFFDSEEKYYVHDQPGVYSGVTRSARHSGNLEPSSIHCLLIHDPENNSYTFDFSFTSPVGQGAESWLGGITVPLDWWIEIPDYEYEGKTDGSIFEGSWERPGGNVVVNHPGLVGLSGARVRWRFVKP